MPREPRAIVDFETRSECDLKKHGSWRYSLDPTTEIMCLAFRLPDWVDGEFGLWHPAFPHLGIGEEDMFGNMEALFDWILSGRIVEAHNSWFERGIWTNISVPRYAFPPIAHHQWRCSAAKAAALALPRALGDVARALRLPIQKDVEGHQLMRKISKPRKALKAEGAEWLNAHGAGKCTQCKGKGTYKRKPCEKCDGGGMFEGYAEDVEAMPTLWHETLEMFADLWAYCGTDVLAEDGVTLAIPDLPQAETDLYLLDQTINERGFQLDPEAVETALRLIAAEAVDLNKQLAEVTDGAVTKATQRQRMVDWFATQELYLPNTQGATIDEYLKTTTGIVHDALSIVRELGRSSTSKYQAMSRWMCPDGRVRGGLLYHGATTGRWSGAGVQPHNFVRGTVKDQVQLWHVLKTEDRQFIREQYGSVMLALANALRGAICAAPGCELHVADYAQIEARVILWLAEDYEHLELFQPGKDIYCDMASSIYNRVIDKKKDPDERQLGKVAILGLGYQMGAKSFIEAAANYKITIDMEMSQVTVDTYRAKFWRIVEMWGDQERAAIEAVSTKGRIPCGRVIWFVEGDFLYCQLPSGRRLAYPYPELRMKETRWGGSKLTLTFEGVNPYTRQWERMSTYGGMLVENLVQAISRDIMAEAMLRAEASGVYRCVLSVHDELVAEAEKGAGTVKEFEALLMERPTWALDCPIAAEGYCTERYRK